MELINKYIYAVTKRLPQAQRDDIDKELRGLIEDMLAERCAGAQPKKQDIEAVLKELGEPSMLAAKYRDTNRYLIGPEYFDLYLLVLKIVLAVAIFGTALGNTIEVFMHTPDNIAQGFGDIIANIITGAFSAFAWVTIIFAVNERVRLSKHIKSGAREWNPSSLPEIPEKRAIIRKSEPIVGIVFAVLFIILFNFASQLIGVYHVEGGEFVSVIPLFSPEGIKQVFPLITVLFCISILKECVKLIVGKWTFTLGVVNAVLSLAALAFCVIIFNNPGIWNTNFINELNASGIMREDTPADLISIWSSFKNGFIYVLTLIFVIEAAVSVFKGIKYKLL